MAQPTIARVQASGKITASNVASMTITMPAPPVVGNSLVIGVFGYRETLAFVTDVKDNRGNTYAKAAEGTTTNAAWLEHAAIWHCTKVVASSGPFVITVTFAGSASYAFADAVEYAGEIVLNQSVAGDQSFVASPTISTPAVSATAALSVGVLSNYVTQSSITEPTGWIVEMEELSAAAIAAGSMVTHGPAPSVAETVTWKLATTSWTAVALAVYQPASATQSITATFRASSAVVQIPSVALMAARQPMSMLI